MRKETEFLNRPVYSAQMMLRQISKVDQRIRANIPDGKYTDATKETVVSFQRAYKIPISGMIDQTDWECIVQAHNFAVEQLSCLRNPFVFTHGTEWLDDAEHKNKNMYVIQAMLLTLSEYYAQLQKPALTGRMDEKTAEDVRWLQRAAGLQETGTINTKTWNYLHILYGMTVA